MSPTRKAMIEAITKSFEAVFDRLDYIEERLVAISDAASSQTRATPPPEDALPVLPCSPVPPHRKKHARKIVRALLSGQKHTKSLAETLRVSPSTMRKIMQELLPALRFIKRDERDRYLYQIREGSQAKAKAWLHTARAEILQTSPSSKPKAFLRQNHTGFALVAPTKTHHATRARDLRYKYRNEYEIIDELPGVDPDSPRPVPPP